MSTPVSVAMFAVLGLALGVLLERLVAPTPAPVEPAAAPGGPGSAPRLAPRRGRRWGRRIALVTVIVVLAGAVGSYLWASSIWNRIEKVDTAGQLSRSTATNYLLVGSDNGRTPGDQRPGVSGARSDTIMILRVENGKATMLSLNRDLWVTNPATGQQGRLNGTYNQGPANLIQAVTKNFGIPVDRYIEIDFASFAGLVDSFGGIDITFEHPAFDRGSGLDVKTAGVVHLDGAQALAFVRARHYVEIIDGKPVPEGGLPDVNRTQRQQAFLRAIMAEVGASKNPFKLGSAASKMADGMRVDDEMTMIDAARFAWNMGRLDPVSTQIPVIPFTTSGGAQVLRPDQPAADQILNQFR